ncbi:MAG: class I lanthipeptide [Saprospiraceae bacterium]|nr:class I lanthipeptide [Saprospiraceae bacterium]
MKQLPKLMLKKETITKLNDDQMKKFVGGIADACGCQSCDKLSCDSKSDAGSCGKKSCNCPNAIDQIADF